MYEVIVKSGFSAAHQLRGYDGKYENLHGHNWGATVVVEAKELDSIGVGIDFVNLKETVEKILGRLDYQNINEVPPFDRQNPSAEHIARWVFHELDRVIRSETTRVKRVEIREFEECGAAYYE
ncbi:MAG: 6-carboxytetrahydropterin synthase QueD [Nitrospinaceae bacterium]|nr:6-carboxytetrahydropterin synthase [Nitrospinaceae bacterium]NIR55562.1 6-carboxytetrahydropterin synthase [Nitrospinaceae bacterium]NIS85996.1 6-carboxytetrahydropterin synthase [Nitrospinaceae bacterium]NIT82842.1 6-carboxytetrahydropterin synthase [Nitrospinaceae bacterium]NIU45044.1 6-carboxytetrahydropterin synthase [Nitrospinaceae bacterium]